MSQAEHEHGEIATMQVAEGRKHKVEPEGEVTLFTKLGGSDTLREVRRGSDILHKAILPSRYTS